MTDFIDLKAIAERERDARAIRAKAAIAAGKATQADADHDHALWSHLIERLQHSSFAGADTRHLELARATTLAARKAMQDYWQLGGDDSETPDATRAGQRLWQLAKLARHVVVAANIHGRHAAVVDAYITAMAPPAKAESAAA